MSARGRWRHLVWLGLTLAPLSASAQMDPYGDMGGGAPSDAGGKQAPVDENEKIRERAGAADEETVIKKKGRPTTPDALYAEALKQMERGNYTKAQEYLERIRIRFPFAPEATMADLKIGDVHFEKGEYDLAVESFKQFRKLHPNHPEVAYAVYMIAYGEFKQAPKWASRDQAATRRALEIINGAPPPVVRAGRRFEDLFPESPYLAQVQQLRQEGMERIARQVYLIGRFYYKKGRFVQGEEKASALRAAVSRLQELERDYPGTEIIPEARYLQVRCLAELGQWDQAEYLHSQLQSEFSESREARRSAVVVGRRPAGGAAVQSEPATTTPPKG